MQKRRAGELGVNHHVIGETPPQPAHGTAQNPLPGTILAVVFTPRLDINRQRQSAAHHGHHDQVMQVTPNLTLVIADGNTQLAAAMPRSSRSGAIDGQANESAVIKGLVPFRLTAGRRQRLTGRLRVQPFGEVRQSVIPRTSGPPPSPAGPRTSPATPHHGNCAPEAGTQTPGPTAECRAAICGCTRPSPGCLRYSFNRRHRPAYFRTPRALGLLIAVNASSASVADAAPTPAVVHSPPAPPAPPAGTLGPHRHAAALHPPTRAESVPPASDPPP